MNEMTTNNDHEQLNDLAVAVIDGYWTLCSPTEAMMFFIEEYLSCVENDKPFYYGDEIAHDRDVIVALSQVLTYFANKPVVEYVPERKTLAMRVGALARRLGLTNRKVRK